MFSPVPGVPGGASSPGAIGREGAPAALCCWLMLVSLHSTPEPVQQDRCRSTPRRGTPNGARNTLEHRKFCAAPVNIYQARHRRAWR
jgi:hypothetical protein